MHQLTESPWAQPTNVFEMAKVTPAWFGAMSAWLLRCPAELQAHIPIDMETILQQEKYRNVKLKIFLASRKWKWISMEYLHNCS